MKAFLITLIALIITQLSASEHKSVTFEVSYYSDRDTKLSSDDLASVHFKSCDKEQSLEIQNTTVWYKIIVENNSFVDQTLFLHNNKAYMSQEIDIYEFDAINQIDQNHFNLRDKQIKNRLSGSSLVYPFTLKAKEIKYLYIRNTSLIHQVVDFEILNRSSSIEHLIKKDIFPIVIVTILLALAFYNAMLFIFGRYKAFFYYALYLLNAGLGLLYMYGTVFYILDVYGKSVYWFNISAILVSLFMALFVQSLFEMKKLNNTMNRWLNVLIYMSLLDVIVAIVFDLNLAMHVLQVLFISGFIVLFSIGIYLIKIKHALARIFLIAYSIYVLGMSITVLALIGVIALNDYTFYASGLGLVIEALAFSYLLHYRMKLLENEIHQQKHALILQKKKAQMGDMIAAIAHQWKQPLNAISSVVTMLHYRISKEETLSSKSLEPKIIQMDEKIEFLKNTIDDFRHFFNPESKKESCDLSELIHNTVNLAHEELLASSITIKTELNFKHKIMIYHNELVHIILNLIQNSKEAFDTMSLENRLIKIIGVTKEHKNIIEVIDNAGGVSDDDMEHIFSEHFTTKKELGGSGLGLYLSRLIIQEHMQGSIEAIQLPKGMIFRITL
ncbi:MAG: sensor histidine kinase [Campylobacterota bacterium]|nr:sensor histidine kinase [Campylobacterota bacterium]